MSKLYTEDSLEGNPYVDPGFSLRDTYKNERLISQGVNPDNPEEVEAYNFRQNFKGSLEGSGLELKVSDAVGENNSRDEKYIKFLNAVRGEGINSERFSVQPNTKAYLLKTYFPGQFGKDGKQSLKGYSPAQIGALFRNFVSYSKEIEKFRG